MRRQSKARQRQQVERRRIVARLGDVPCALRTSVCTGRAEALHELVGAAQGGSRTDRRNVSPCCSRCNSYIEDNPNMAYVNGWKVRREHGQRGDNGLVPAVPSRYAVATIEGGNDDRP